MGNNYITDTPKEKKCPVCGVYVNEKDDFCTNCGARFKAVSKKTPPETVVEKKENKKMSNAILIGVLAAVMLVMAIAIGFFVFQTIQVSQSTNTTMQTNAPVTQPTTRPTQAATQAVTQTATQSTTASTVHSHTPVSIGEAKSATCLESGYTSGIKCSTCGVIIEEQMILSQKEHEWQSATCTHPATCTICGTTQGGTSEHSWKTSGSATVCVTCGQSRETYLNEMTWSSKNCKFYYYSFEPVTFPHNLNWNDTNTKGYVASARDIWGNIYKYGMHLDSGDDGPYWVSYYLDGCYTKFTATLSCPSESAGGTRAPASWYHDYYKVVTIYLDGRAAWSSPRMYTDSQPVPIDLDITGVNTFKVEYTGSGYANEITVLYDGLFT